MSLAVLGGELHYPRLSFLWGPQPSLVMEQYGIFKWGQASRPEKLGPGVSYNRYNPQERYKGDEPPRSAPVRSPFQSLGSMVQLDHGTKAGAESGATKIAPKVP